MVQPSDHLIVSVSRRTLQKFLYRWQESYIFEAYSIGDSTKIKPGKLFQLRRCIVGNRIYIWRKWPCSYVGLRRTCWSDDSSSMSTPYRGNSPPQLVPNCKRRTPEIDDMIPAGLEVGVVFSASASSILSNGRSISVCLSIYKYDAHLTRYFMYTYHHHYRHHHHLLHKFWNF